VSRATWPVARRYVLPPAAGAAVLLAGGRRSGWVAAGFAASLAAFFRDPDRPLDVDPDVVYAAADGLVTSVDAGVEERWFPSGRGDRVTVFLSLHNVHVTRSPVAGRLERSEELGNGFAPALFRRAADNRRNRLLLDADGTPVVVVQVAGAIARTITNWVRPGDRLTAGQRLAVIHFGSRTDVLVPSEAAEVLVRPRQRVRAGVTPLFRLRQR
jgi:phosphatidylserine decarboxylase